LPRGLVRPSDPRWARAGAGRAGDYSGPARQPDGLGGTARCAAKFRRGRRRRRL